MDFDAVKSQVLFIFFSNSCAYVTQQLSNNQTIS